MKDLVSEYVMAFVECMGGIGIIYIMTKFANALIDVIG